MLRMAIQLPKMLAATAKDVHRIGSATSEANSATILMTGVIPATPDEASALRHAQSTDAAMHWTVNAQPTAVNELFVISIENSAGSCATTEAANLIVMS